MENMVGLPPSYSWSPPATGDQCQSQAQAQLPRPKGPWKWLQWFRKKRLSTEGKVVQGSSCKTKQSIMGRFGFLRKSSDKDKPDKSSDPSSSNPYLQQQSPSQYDGNQYYAENSQRNAGPPGGSRVGLPSSVRPSGLPNRMIGPESRSDTFGSNKTAPPPYREDSPSPPVYSTGGSSPAPGFNSVNPSMGSGYPRDKFGAADGFGGQRYGSTEAQNSQFSSRPAAAGGGYGGLSGSTGGSFANYDGFNSTVPSSGLPANMEEMTEEEREEAKVQMTKNAIVDELRATLNTGERTEAKFDDGIAMLGSLTKTLLEQGDSLQHTKKSLVASQGEAGISQLNMADLEIAKKSIANPASWIQNSSSRTAAREQKKKMVQLQNEQRLEQLDRDEVQSRQNLEKLNQLLEQGTRQKPLLGSNKQKNHSAFEFEDDTGEQRELNEQIDALVPRLEQKARVLNQIAVLQRGVIDQQLVEVSSMTELADTARDSIARNQQRMDTKFGRYR
ncbi:hypothetical protein N656DRAFT_779854 [Canariomyces notabilis]|uniref:t-SNARE coiled-coil homology domain-containing protein n=1 Tax=Canariomyces notabilis TaxID=2074819 RepID=A0AAN6TCC2_9PEZI|nr:hypothetical protein N656DRAFT_779854 [Canariomyces arenarius]